MEQSNEYDSFTLLSERNHLGRSKLNIQRELIKEFCEIISAFEFAIMESQDQKKVNASLNIPSFQKQKFLSLV